MKKNKGFTLVEILAVIIVLGVISAIIYPMLNKVMKENRKKAYVQSLNSVVRSAELYKTDSGISTLEPILFNNKNIEYENKSSIKQGAITEKDGKIYLNSFYNGEFCASGYENNFIITEEKCSEPAVIQDYCFFTDYDTITGYDSSNISCNKNNIIIPSEINGTKIKTIGDSAFYSMNFKEVIIEEGITTIEESAFENNQLISVTLPNSIKEIGNFVFSDNQLASVTIPKGVERIGFYGFSYNQISNLIFEKGIITIDQSAFAFNQLTSVIIPDSVKTIAFSAFKSNQLTSITIPNSVTSIGSSAFNDNKLPDSEAFIYERKSDGSIDNTVLVSYGGKNRTNVIIPNNVSKIGNDAFGYLNVTNITIPNSVTTIDNFAFEGNKLTNITLSNNITSIGSGAFNNNLLPDNQAFIYERKSDGSIDNTVLVSYGGEKRTNVIIPNNVIEIASSSFGSNQLTSITIPNSVTSISNGAFQDNQLTSITIPSSVTSIGEVAFNRNQLTSVIIPNSVTSIGSRAFFQNKLISVTIPSSVTTINSLAFGKSSWSNIDLTTIHNLNTTKSFNWNNITGVGTSSSCTFVGAGTCDTITILAS